MKMAVIDLEAAVSSIVPPVIPWKEMTRNQKRIRVAREVLALINDGTVIPSNTGDAQYERVYCKVINETELHRDWRWRSTPQFTDVCEAITKKRKQKKCTACAVGALMIGTLLAKGKFDDCSIVPKKLAEATMDDREVSVEVIRGVFSEQELAVIELCYEGTSSPTDAQVEDMSVRDRCLNFVYAVSKENRIQLLMQSIIDNDGKLVIPSVD